MDRVLNVQFPKLYLVQSRCSLKVKWMKSEINIKAGQDDFRRCLPTLRYHGLMIPRPAFHLQAIVQGLFNIEISQRDESIIGASGFNPSKHPLQATPCHPSGTSEHGYWNRCCQTHFKDCKLRPIGVNRLLQGQHLTMRLLIP